MTKQGSLTVAVGCATTYCIGLAKFKPKNNPDFFFPHLHQSERERERERERESATSYTHLRPHETPYTLE